MEDYVPLKSSQQDDILPHHFVSRHRKGMVQHHSTVSCGQGTALLVDTNSDNISY